MLQNKYICILHCLSSGLNEDNLGSDEQELIAICNIIIDVINHKTVDLCHYLIKPRFNSVSFLTEDCKKLSNINDETIFENANTLDQVISMFDKYLIEKKLHPSQMENEFVFLLDSSLHLRQALIPECQKKNIDLPFYYYKYINLKDEFNRYTKGLLSNKIKNINDIAKHMSIDPINEGDYLIRQSYLIERAVIKMLDNGYEFNNFQKISKDLSQGVCLEETVNENTIVRVRGLPWQCTEQDVGQFFAGLDIAPSGVALCLSIQGRRNGEALVRFIDEENRNLALRRHKHHIGQRYIEVYKANAKDYLNVACGTNAEVKSFLSRNGKVIIRMRGLPFDSSAKDVVNFFEQGENGSEIIDGEIGVLFVHYPDGRVTGDAFVMFKDDESANKALLKHKETMGSRYIELFRSTSAEVQQVFKRSQDPKYYQNASKDLSTIPLSVLPPEMSGAKKDCVRLKNLPIECHVEHILEFLGIHSQHIVQQGVHMILNAQGNPSGEAFIQFDSEQSAFNVFNHKNGRCMFYSGRKYLIEVIQCSGEEMNLVLLGFLPSNLVSTNNSNNDQFPYQTNIKQQNSKISPNFSQFPNYGVNGRNNFKPQTIKSNYLNLNHNTNNQIGPFGTTSLMPPPLPTITQLNAPLPLPPSQNSSLYITNQHITSNALQLNQYGTNGAWNIQPLIYWYPTPPVSPTSKIFFHTTNPPTTLVHTIPTTCVLILKGAPIGITIADIMQIFNGYEIIPECIQIQNNMESYFNSNINSTVDVLITFFNRSEAERACIEKNHSKIGNNTIELFLAI